MVARNYLLFVPCLLLISTCAIVFGDSKVSAAQTRTPSSNRSKAVKAAAPVDRKDLNKSTPIAPFNNAAINWRQFNGESIEILLSGHPIQGTIIGLLSEFNKLTGITVKVDVLPEEDFFQKLDIDLASHKGNIDVFMISPLYQWKYAEAKWIEDLRPYVDNPTLTDRDWYNPEDFFPTLWMSSMWDGTVGGGLGQGALYSIPSWWEGCTLMYRKDLAEKYNFTEPKDWDDLYQQVIRIPKLSNGKLYGFNGRGISSWSQIHTYHMTMMASQGATDLDPITGRAAFNSPLGIEVGRYWIKMMRDAGSPNWPNYNWYEVTSEFQAGKFFAIMDANPFAIILEAAGSPLKGKVGYLLPPPGVKGRESFLWTWGLGISSFSKHKGAGWLFVQWITSKSTLRKAVAYGNWMAPRQSVWFDPEVASFLRTIDNGRWYENSTKLVSEMVEMRWSPNPLAPMLGNLWAGAVQDAWRGDHTIEEALNKAAGQVDEMMKAAGYSR